MNHWTDFLSECPRAKILCHRGKLSDPDCPEMESFRHRSMLSESGLYLSTHYGFGVRPFGRLVRQLEPKMFFSDDGGQQAFYVSQRFDDNVSRFSRSYPVVMLEGVLDVEVFSEVTEYPFVMGYLTSSVPHNMAMMVALLTNRVIVVPDNDKDSPKNWGYENLGYTLGNLKRFGVQVDVLKFEEFKDFGEVWPRKELHSLIRARVNAVL